MRWKIIVVNGGIVLVLTFVTFFLLKTSLATVLANPKARRAELVQAVHAAEARLTLDALMGERWLSQQASDDQVRSVFDGGTRDARSDSATSVANQLRDRAVSSPEFARMAPSLFLFVDAEGVGLGRNGSELMRGDRVADAYPTLAEALRAGKTASALWVNEKRHEQLIASFSPVRGENGELVGALVLGTPLNDERMNRISDVSSGSSVALVVGESNRPIARGGPPVAGFESPGVTAAIAGARAGSLTHAPALVESHLFAAVPINGFEGSGAVLVGSSPASLVASVDSILWPIFAVGFLGLFLVLVGGVLLGNYISKPISEIEEGLLLIMNGQQDLRFDLEHDELGGLTSRMNGLLNSILGVPEDQTGES